MTQIGKEPRLALERFAKLPVGEERLLHRDSALQPQISGEIYRSHASLSNGAFDTVSSLENKPGFEHVFSVAEIEGERENGVTTLGTHILSYSNRRRQSFRNMGK